MWPGPAAEVAEDPGKEEGWRQRGEAERKQTPCSVKSFSTCFLVLCCFLRQWEKWSLAVLTFGICWGIV